MIRRAVALCALGLILALPSCATGGGSTTAPRRDPDVISAAELADPSIRTLSVLDALSRLRPTWIRPRGPTSLVSAGDRFPAVMLNESVQPFEVLRTLRAGEVTAIRYLNGADATTRYGTGYVNGLIQVSTAPPTP
jgi:hypothetical protein